MSSVELKGLKGLRSLNSLTADTATIPLSNEQVKKLPLNFLIPGKYQPRKNIDDAVLNELADSIKAQGIIQPLIVKQFESDKYEIIAGERRWRAARIAGITHIPVIVRQVEDSVAFAYAIIENIQRENLNPVEEALAFARFHDEFAMTHEQIAHMVGRARASITNTLRLLTLQPQVLKLLEDGKLDMGHARALLTLNDEEQIDVALMIVKKQLNVREAEKLAHTAKSSNITRNIQKSTLFEQQCEDWSHRLSQKFSSKVSVKLNANGTGKVVIQINSPDEISWLIDHIKID